MADQAKPKEKQPQKGQQPKDQKPNPSENLSTSERGKAQQPQSSNRGQQFDNPQKRKQAQKQQIVQLKPVQKEVSLFLICILF